MVVADLIHPLAAQENFDNSQWCHLFQVIEIWQLCTFLKTAAPSSDDAGIWAVKCSF